MRVRVITVNDPCSQRAGLVTCQRPEGVRTRQRNNYHPLGSESSLPVDFVCMFVCMFKEIKLLSQQERTKLKKIQTLVKGNG